MNIVKIEESEISIFVEQGEQEKWKVVNNIDHFVN